MEKNEEIAKYPARTLSYAEEQYENAKQMKEQEKGYKMCVSEETKKQKYWDEFKKILVGEDKKDLNITDEVAFESFKASVNRHRFIWGTFFKI